MLSFTLLCPVGPRVKPTLDWEFFVFRFSTSDRLRLLEWTIYRGEVARVSR